ncbi:MAG: hypothetical protein ACSLE1_12700 [Sphingobium sp.]
MLGHRLREYFLELEQANPLVAFVPLPLTAFGADQQARIQAIYQLAVQASQSAVEPEPCDLWEFSRN